MTQIHNIPPKGYGYGLGSRDYKRIAIGQAETIKKLEEKVKGLEDGRAAWKSRYLEQREKEDVVFGGYERQIKELRELPEKLLARIAELERQLWLREQQMAKRDERIAELEKATTWRSPETAPRDGMFLALIERDRGFGRKPKYVYPMQFSTHKDGIPNARFFYGFGAYRDELPEDGRGAESKLIGWLPLPQVKEDGK